jgi:hypothetical protein
LYLDEIRECDVRKTVAAEVAEGKVLPLTAAHGAFVEALGRERAIRALEIDADAPAVDDVVVGYDDVGPAVAAHVHRLHGSRFEGRGVRDRRLERA